MKYNSDLISDLMRYQYITIILCDSIQLRESNDITRTRDKKIIY